MLLQIWVITSLSSNQVKFSDRNGQVRWWATRAEYRSILKVFSFGLMFFHISNQYQGNYIKLHQFVTNWRETNLVPIFFSAISKARVFVSIAFKMFAESIDRNVNQVWKGPKLNRSQLLPASTYFLANVMKYIRTKSQSQQSQIQNTLKTNIPIIDRHKSI